MITNQYETQNYDTVLYVQLSTLGDIIKLLPKQVLSPWWCKNNCISNRTDRLPGSVETRKNYQTATQSWSDEMWACTHWSEHRKQKHTMKHIPNTHTYICVNTHTILGHLWGHYSDLKPTIDLTLTLTTDPKNLHLTNCVPHWTSHPQRTSH